MSCRPDDDRPIVPIVVAFSACLVTQIYKSASAAEGLHFGPTPKYNDERFLHQCPQTTARGCGRVLHTRCPPYTPQRFQFRRRKQVGSFALARAHDDTIVQMCAPRRNEKNKERHNKRYLQHPLETRASGDGTKAIDDNKKLAKSGWAVERSVVASPGERYRPTSAGTTNLPRTRSMGRRALTGVRFSQRMVKQHFVCRPRAYIVCCS